jgi:NADPH:quinone reductase-like Zn-dependent oxidoreductase
MAQNTMNCIRFHPPGGPEKLKYENEARPSEPTHGQVLIQVKAIGLIWTELYWPIYQNADGEYVSHIPGHDFSGTIVEVGPGCDDSGLKVGDEVMAFTARRNHGE